MFGADKHPSSEFIVIPKLVGRYEQVRVSFIGASFLRSQAAQARYADDEFGPFILDNIFDRQSILSKYKGVLKKAHHCRKCNADLTGLKTRRRKFSLDLSYKQLPPFKVEIEMPAVPCRACGTNNALNDKSTEYIVCGAIAKAFESLKKYIKA
jgi:hypothetical protein